MTLRHLPQGRRGLKSRTGLTRCATLQSHLPQGRRGLKYLESGHVRISTRVTFRREGVDWNNILNQLFARLTGSPSAGKVWIEIIRLILIRWNPLSPSAGKAWIEIFLRWYDSRLPKSPSAGKAGSKGVRPPYKFLTEKSKAVEQIRVKTS